MGNGEERPREGNGDRRVVYCVVPFELAAKLHDPLRRHFRDEPHVEVIVEQRRHERRRAGDRRQAGEVPGHAGQDRPGSRDHQRRRIRSAAGRRVGERRAASVGVDPPPLPRRLARWTRELEFVERFEPATREAEDIEAGRLVTRFQAGDHQAFTELYARYFDRVYGYLRMMLRDAHEAEDATQQVFLRLFEKLGEYERRGQPFWAWLLVVVRNTAISNLRKRRRLDVEDPAETQRRLENEVAASEADPLAVSWISDRDLLLFVERLPQVQQQVLLLRFMLDLTPREVAEVLGRTPEEIRKIQHRALAYLRTRLAAMGRKVERRERPAPWRRRVTQVRSSRARRFALLR